MSSFSSILASLGKGGQQGQLATPSLPSPSNDRADTVASQSSARIQRTPDIASTAGAKRKAEAASSAPSGKQARTEPPSKHASTLASSGPNGATRPSGGISAPVPAPAPASARAPAAEPPKNSFRAILARAELAKTKQKDFGQIKHKHIVKPTKRQQRLAREAELKEKSRSSKQLMGSEPQKQSGNIGKARVPAKPDLGYKGTMRPKPPLPEYKGTMKPSGSVSNAKTPSREHHRSRNSRYSDDDDGYDDSEDEAEDDDDEDEGEAGNGSDMDATGFEQLEREEELSLRAAKKEDEEALRQESEHRRQKAEKRKRLEALVAARAGRR